MEDILKFFDYYGVRLKYLDDNVAIRKVAKYIQGKDFNFNNSHHIDNIRKCLAQFLTEFEVFNLEKNLPNFAVLEQKEKELLNIFFSHYVFVYSKDDLIYRKSIFIDKKRDELIAELIKNTQLLKKISPELIIRGIFKKNKEKETYIIKGLFKLIEKELNKNFFRENLDKEFPIIYAMYIKECFEKREIKIDKKSIYL